MINVMQKLRQYLTCIRSGKTPMHRYKHGFSGFAAHLSEDEAHLMAKQPGVVSVFPDQMLQLHTTRSWDFLVQESYQRDTYFSEINYGQESEVHEGDTIIGFLDSGDHYGAMNIYTLLPKQILNAAYSDGGNRNLARGAEL